MVAYMRRLCESVILTVAYYVVLFPLGLAIRMVGWDPLRLRRSPPGSSYWVPVPEKKQRASHGMTNSPINTNGATLLLGGHLDEAVCSVPAPSVDGERGVTLTDRQREKLNRLRDDDPNTYPLW